MWGCSRRVNGGFDSPQPLGYLAVNTNGEPATMIDVTEAVALARKSFLLLHEGEGVSDVRMAEAELDRDGTTWLVTLGYADEEVSGIAKHKVLRIDAESGQVRSIKVRAL